MQRLPPIENRPSSPYPKSAQQDNDVLVSVRSALNELRLQLHTIVQQLDLLEEEVAHNKKTIQKMIKM